jgi:hypothetical protein
MTAFIPSSSITRPSALRPLNMVTWQDSPFLTSAAQEMSLASATLPSVSTTFEPIVPDTSVLLGFLGIILVSAVAGWVWANQVVPVSRTNLAISKRTGPVKDYLDELREAGANTAVSNATETGSVSSSSTGKSREFEQWLFTDWLEKPEKKAGRQKEPALPILKNAKWNSGDNPVLAASALIGLGVLFTSVTERIAASF